MLESIAFHSAVNMTDHGPVVVSDDFSLYFEKEMGDFKVEDGKYVFTPKAKEVFGSCFNHLKRLDKLSRVPSFVTKIISYFQKDPNPMKYGFYNRPPRIVYY